MTYFFSMRQTGLLLLAGALLAGASPVARAQESIDARGVVNRVNQLEKDLQTLNRAVFRGDAPTLAAGDAALSPTALGMIEDRLRQGEETQRRLTGQVEELQFALRQVQDQLRRLQADIDMRLQAPVSTGAASLPTVDQAVRAQDAPSAPVVTPPPEGAQYVLGTRGGLPTDMTPEGQYEAAFADLRNSDFEKARHGFEKFLEAHGDHALAANAQYWLAETFYVRGDFQQAARLFAKGYQDFPQSGKAADCLLKLGLSLAQLGKKADACLSFRQLLQDFPGEEAPVSRRARQEMSQLDCG